MSITTSDSSPPAVRQGSSDSNSACLFDPRGGSTSGVSVFVALGSSGAVPAERLCPCVRSTILCNILARYACPDGGVTDSPGRAGGGNVAAVAQTGRRLVVVLQIFVRMLATFCWPVLGLADWEIPAFQRLCLQTT